MEVVAIFYVHLAFSTAIWYIFVIWYILWWFGIFYGDLVYFLYQRRIWQPRSLRQKPGKRGDGAFQCLWSSQTALKGSFLQFVECLTQNFTFLSYLDILLLCIYRVTPSQPKKW
jgi:hypothetical protein